MLLPEPARTQSVIASHLSSACTPHQIRNIEPYDGCVSWVELEKPVSVAGADPVRQDLAFEEHVERVRQRTDATSSVGPTVRQKCC